MEFSQVSSLIACPVCKIKSSKIWNHWCVTHDKRMIDKVSFECLNCNSETQVLDRKLVDYISKNMGAKMSWEL